MYPVAGTVLDRMQFVHTVIGALRTAHCTPDTGREPTLALCVNPLAPDGAQFWVSVGERVNGANQERCSAAVEWKPDRVLCVDVVRGTIEPFMPGTTGAATTTAATTPATAATAATAATPA